MFDIPFLSTVVMGILTVVASAIHDPATPQFPLPDIARQSSDPEQQGPVFLIEYDLRATGVGTAAPAACRHIVELRDGQRFHWAGPVFLTRGDEVEQTSRCVHTLHVRARTDNQVELEVSVWQMDAADTEVRQAAWHVHEVIPLGLPVQLLLSTDDSGDTATFSVLVRQGVAR